jgi:hypothetical protein
MFRPKLLDLFCGAGGASMGYHRAGFNVVGVDIEDQPNYPFKFIRADALNYPLDGFDVIHASPPCQVHCNLAKKEWHDDLIPQVRERLKDKLYVIENIEGSGLVNPIRLCGSSFGLVVQRHRLFESSIQLEQRPCDHSWWKPVFFQNDYRLRPNGSKVVPVYGECRYVNDFMVRCAAMGIPWMDNKELSQAIPPAYTEYIGRQIIISLNRLT